MQLLNNLFKVDLKNADIICFMLMSLVSLSQANVKKSGKVMKIVNAEKENPRMIILKITKRQGFIFTLKNTFLKKPQIEPEPF